jgi:predicted dehydrogenase
LDPTTICSGSVAVFLTGHVAGDRGEQLGLRIGVIGTGKLGREHVRVLSGMGDVDYLACHDIDADRAQRVGEEFNARAFTDAEALMSEVDAVSIVVPSSVHAQVAVGALEAGKDVFLEKPIAGDVPSAERIVEAARRNGRILQMGHVERFNPAVEAALPHIQEPSFIEVHRLANFVPRGIDVSVATDLMIHDIDLLFLFMDCPPSDIRAKGAGILTPGPDIINARLEYPNGCVANLTASRVSMEPMRKVRIFSRNQYLSIDLLHRSVKRYEKKADFEKMIAKLHHLGNNAQPIDMRDFLVIEESEASGEEPLGRELEAFCRSVMTRSEPPVTGEDGLRALRLVESILEKIERDTTFPSSNTPRSS